MPPIDLEELAGKKPDQLSDEEKRFLQDRGELPEGVDPVSVTFAVQNSDQVVTNDPTALAKEAYNSNSEYVEAEVRRRVEAELALVGQAQQHAALTAETPHTGGAVPNGQTAEEARGTTANDSDDDYDSWTVIELRGEIAERNDALAAAQAPPEAMLSIDGKKSDLIAALRADDAKDSDDTEGTNP